MFALTLAAISADLIKAEAARLLRAATARPLTPGEASDLLALRDELARR